MGLKVARHIGHHGLSRPECSPIGKREVRLGIGKQLIRGDSLVRHTNLVVIDRRVQRVLPVCRGDAQIALFEIKQMLAVTQA